LPTDDEMKSILSNIQFTIRLEEPVSAAFKTLTNGHEKPAEEFGLTKDRVDYVLSLVGKKANAALSGKTGNHFRVYPPQEFLNNPDVVKGGDIYEALKDTVWWVRWYDDQYDQLSFIELLIFVNQIIATKLAFEKGAKEVVKHPAIHRGSKHAGGWQPKKDRDRKLPKKKDAAMTISVNGGFAPAELAKDEMTRVLLSKVELESTPKPNVAMN